MKSRPEMIYPLVGMFVVPTMMLLWTVAVDMPKHGDDLGLLVRKWPQLLLSLSLLVISGAFIGALVGLC